ncbi:rhoptry family protein [Mycoplasmopsis alligatoris]|uniref:F5/8 type C domain protein n=1 Tax=Mycoplasmopsis alligatoris A21JP2 TaxID=747682 RepID=D4XUY2_9BACT|nr:hypothetical protein [Mycoplasmopsis alligatoris]EFF41811.1 hypothetical protein MALL_0139 [Mycoplasmopsis alligatoris A21JP2]
MNKKTKRIIVASTALPIITAATALLTGYSATYVENDSNKIKYLNRLQHGAGVSINIEGFNTLNAQTDAIDGNLSTAWVTGPNNYPGNDTSLAGKRYVDISFQEQPAVGRFFQIMFKDRNVTQLSLEVLGNNDQKLFTKYHFGPTANVESQKNKFIIDFKNKITGIKKIRILIEVWDTKNYIWDSTSVNTSIGINEIMMFEGSIDLDYVDKAESKIKDLKNLKNQEFYTSDSVASVSGNLNWLRSKHQSAFNNEVSNPTNFIKVEEKKPNYQGVLKSIDDSINLLKTNKEALDELIDERKKDYAATAGANNKLAIDIFNKALDAIHAKYVDKEKLTRNEAEPFFSEIKKLTADKQTPKFFVLSALREYKKQLDDTVEEKSRQDIMKWVDTEINSVTNEKNEGFDEKKKKTYMDRLGLIDKSKVTYKSHLEKELETIQNENRDLYTIEAEKQFLDAFTKIRERVSKLTSLNKNDYEKIKNELNELKKNTLVTKSQDLLNKLNLAKSKVSITDSKESVLIYRKNIDKLIEEVNNYGGSIDNNRHGEILTRLGKLKEHLISYKDQLKKALDEAEKISLEGVEGTSTTTFKEELKDLKKQLETYTVIDEKTYNAFNKTLTNAKGNVVFNKDIILKHLDLKINEELYTKSSVDIFKNKATALKDEVNKKTTLNLNEYDLYKVKYENIKEENLVTYRKYLQDLIKTKAPASFEYLTAESKTQFVSKFTEIVAAINKPETIFTASNYKAEEAKINNLPKLQSNAEKLKEVIANYKSKFTGKSSIYVGKSIEDFNRVLDQQNKALDKAQLTIEKYDEAERLLKEQSEKLQTYNALFKDEVSRLRTLNKSTYYTSDSFDLFVEGVNRLNDRIANDQLTNETYVRNTDKINDLALNTLVTHDEVLRSLYNEINDRHAPTFYSKSTYDTFKQEMEQFREENFPEGEENKNFTSSQFRAKKAQLEAFDINLLDSRLPWKPWVLIGAAIADSIAILVIVALLIVKFLKKS